MVTLAEPFETIINNGSSQNRIDIAVLGDGYSPSEMTKYRADVQKFIQGIFAQEPYREYQRYFNVHRIDVISNQSGADHPERNPPLFVDTALDSTYNCGNLLRLICFNEVKVYDIIFRTLSASQFDVILVLVNDAQYGGAGGQVPVASAANPDSVETILHELGHSFARLADEYGDPGVNCNPMIEPSEPNATKETLHSLIKWNRWIAPITPIPTTSTAPAMPGLYVGARHCETGVYRPTFDSKMRSLGRPFEQINTEQHVKRVYNFVSPIDGSSPAGNTVTLNSNQTQTFNVTTPQPFTHTLNVNWLIDGQQMGIGNSFTIRGETLALGNHTVRAVISDSTPFVRSDPQQLLSENRDWTVTVQTVTQHTLFDFDGDGKSDISVFRPSNGYWYISKSSGGYSSVQWGKDKDVPAPGDYDGDGKTDLAVFRYGSGAVTVLGEPIIPDTFYVLRSSDNTFYARDLGLQNGLDNKPVPGDYDGDGKTDLAVYSSGDGVPSPGYFVVLQSSTNAKITTQWGLNSDKIVPADYDGDGKADLAVYRKGIWYILQSSNG
ncbi:MAG: M64 family metallopeptidase, partial [Pyrinomonadaceae bacterium]